MISIIFEHTDWLVALKPPGMNFHTQEQTPGFVVELEKQLGIKLWPVHRLDKLTSGLLLLAKDKDTCASLSDLFAQQKVSKYYLAVCPTSMKKKQGLVKGDMTSARRGAFKLLKTNQNPAITQFFSTSLKPGYRLCLLKPKSGKTHQLRVAMKSIGAPIIGDTLYGGASAERLYLHSYVLKFEYGGESFCIKHPPEEEGLFALDNALTEQNWLEPWKLTWPTI